ncbi:MAG: U-box domain-containing protein [Candidatus Berkiella sp.]
MQHGAGAAEEQSDIYIFAAMDANSGYALLMNKAKDLPNIAQIKASGQPLWLLRESNTQVGMLTVDFITWNEEKNNWIPQSTRMALHPQKGWINASDPKNPDFIEAKQSMTQVNAETADKHQQSLQAYLDAFPNARFSLENRMNPLKSQQAQAPIYTTYITDQQPANQKALVPLTPGVAQAITCELSGKVFKDPVVLNRDITLPGVSGRQLKLGRSYEKSELEKLGINSSNFYANFTLKKIVNRLGCNDAGLMENLSNDRLVDPVMLDTMSNPQILPSSHSLSKETIDGMIASGRTLRCPETQQPFTQQNVVPNVNLDRFIKAWPECQRLLVETLRTPNANLKPKL